MARIVTTFLFLSWFSTVALGQHMPFPIIRVRQEDLMSLINDLLTAVKPDNPANAYMPAFMKDRINWIYLQSVTRKTEIGKDMVQVVTDPTRHWGQALMYSAYGADKLPYISIVGDNVFGMVRVDGRTSMGFTQTHKNTFGVALVHEAVHLERSKEFFTTKRSREETIDLLVDEEFRTWVKVDQLVVTPLLEAGQPLSLFFVDNHKVLKVCNYKQPCRIMTDMLRANVVVK